MWFWWFMLVCDIITPIIMILGGLLMWKHCPRSVNSFVGYRTARSMKSIQAWEFAQEYCGKLWLKIGVLLLPVSVIPLIPLFSLSENIIAAIGSVVLIIQMAILICSVFPTERALKNKFNGDGALK